MIKTHSENLFLRAMGSDGVGGEPKKQHTPYRGKRRGTCHTPTATTPSFSDTHTLVAAGVVREEKKYVEVNTIEQGSTIAFIR